MKTPSSWKKAAALIGGLILVGAADLAGVKASTIEIMGMLVTAFILGQGAADWGKNRRTAG